MGARHRHINVAVGQAQAMLAVATATAEGIRRVAEATMISGGFEAMQLKLAEQYITQFGNLAKVNNTMIIPAQLSDVAAMIATAMSVIKPGATDTGSRR